MTLKIMLTGDVHLGRKFSSYPEDTARQLEQARFRSLKNVVNEACRRECNLLVIAGDLFDKVTILEGDLLEAINILSEFSGDLVVVLPGNHDFAGVDLWDNFQRKAPADVVLLDKTKPYELNRFDLKATIYPAPCDDRTSRENNLDWIKKEDIKDDRFKLGVAHGALQGISPDMTDSYFSMRSEELRKLNIDLWLLGHTHIPLPKNVDENIQNEYIFNCGTPEPDGLDCSHEGQAWYIELEKDGSTKAIPVKTGEYRFLDIAREVNSEDDFACLLQEVRQKEKAEKTVMRIKIFGRIPEAAYKKKQEYYRKFRDSVFHLQILDDDLNLQLNRDKIAEEFPEGSFPYQVLEELIDDERALELAYELLQEVKQ